MPAAAVRRQLGQRPNHDFRALEAFQPAGKHDHPGLAQPQATPKLACRLRQEGLQVDAGRDHADPASTRPVQVHEVVRLLGAGGDQSVGLANDHLLDRDPMLRFDGRSLGGALVLDPRQRVKGMEPGKHPVRPQAGGGPS